MLSKGQVLCKYQNERMSCDQWTRVMGYYRPAVLYERGGGKPLKGSSYNIGKQGEYKERIFFKTQSGK